MLDYRAHFAGKKITLMGLGLLGRGEGDAAFLAACGAHLVVTDKKSESELAEPVARLKKYPNVTFSLGGHRIEDFTHADLVIKAAGVPLGSSEIAAAKKAGVLVAMSTALFAKYAAERGARIVGVTGTRGKSTVSALIYESLKKAGKRAHLGGNVRGKSTLAMLPEIEAGDICVLELDSWQLQGFGDLQMSPHIAVFSNLMPDHQNYYRDMDAYFADKANIFAFQNEGDTLIAGKKVAERIALSRTEVPENLPGDWQLKIVGEHNRENAALAAAALRPLGLSESEIRSGIESFEGVEGRLQLVRELRGVKIYNDNNATTPEATIAALLALGEKRNVILIAGGSDKGLNMQALVALIKDRCKAVYLLQGTGTDRLRKDLLAPVCGSLNEALQSALDASVPGDVILFSPAFASFGMFKNEYERNDLFLALVRNL
ncbi:MAG: hypothetical protein HYS26_04805 [Candidatus Kaiserbacteria bacterium]|nr:MAG: hypothetical protein HYS26_04805 [Candidatus Kaiserbacteria bacterium]